MQGAITQLRITASLVRQLLTRSEELALDEFDTEYTLEQFPQVLSDLATHLEELPARKNWPK